MENDLKDSGVVTVLSVIGFVFGLIGMLGSFIPCIGGIAFAIGIPAALLSALSVIIAYASHAKKTFAIVALTISLIGVVISGWQFITIRQAGKLFEKEISKSQHTSNDSKLSPRAHSATTTPSQADKWQVKSWDDCFSDLKSAISSKNREKIKKILLNMQGKYKSEFDKQDPSMVFRYNYDYWTSAALFMIGKYDNNDYLDGVVQKVIYDKNSRRNPNTLQVTDKYYHENSSTIIVDNNQNLIHISPDSRGYQSVFSKNDFVRLIYDKPDHYGHNNVRLLAVILLCKDSSAKKPEINEEIIAKGIATGDTPVYSRAFTDSIKIGSTLYPKNFPYGDILDNLKKNEVVDIYKVALIDTVDRYTLCIRTKRGILGYTRGNIKIREVITDQGAILAVYLSTPYEYECDVDAVKEDIDFFKEFLLYYPNSLYSAEAKCKCIELYLYSIQCNLDDLMLNTTLKDIENLYNELKILCKKYKNCSDVKQVYDQYKNMQKQMLKRDINMSKLGDLMKRQKQLWLSLPSALDR